jgi:hypothetical protein
MVGRTLGHRADSPGRTQRLRQLHSVLVERHGEAAAFDFMLKLAVALTAPPVKGPTTLRSWCG